MIPGTLLACEPVLLRDTVRRCIERESALFPVQSEALRSVPRPLWRKTGGAGADYRDDVSVYAEMTRGGFSGPGFLNYLERSIA